ncbi:hypothetical protein PYCCODRAFT_1478912 [Trametes coccinea BRFM310]|uniref:Uncharacterized protein n=1 Tax=Trametes coccinea (strain BRFM310) TaxID=1353009 RepID=A0A1Y2IIF1_TRAC3|nr:hypothetical protein PYCCODRAFT_1478912 [Trametes coccinea BRFM310]
MSPLRRNQSEANVSLQIPEIEGTTATAILDTVSLPTINPPSVAVTATSVLTFAQDFSTPPIDPSSMPRIGWQSEPPPVPSYVPAPSSNTSFVDGVAGGILGCLVALLFVLAAIILFRRYRRRCRCQETHSHDGPQEQRRELSVEVTQTGWSAPAPVSIHASRDTDSTSSLLHPSTRRSSLTSIEFPSPRPYSYVTRTSVRAETPLPPTEPSASSAITPPVASSPMLFESAFVAMSSGPPSHAVDVPDPALSVTGTDRSLRHDELTRQIQALEAEIQDLHYPGGLAERHSSNPGEQQRASARMIALKEEIAELRAQVRRERRLMMEAPPRRGRRGRRGKALALVT